MPDGGLSVSVVFPELTISNRLSEQSPERHGHRVDLEIAAP